MPIKKIFAYFLSILPFLICYLFFSDEFRGYKLLLLLPIIGNAMFFQRRLRKKIPGAFVFLIIALILVGAAVNTKEMTGTQEESGILVIIAVVANLIASAISTLFGLSFALVGVMTLELTEKP